MISLNLSPSSIFTRKVLLYSVISISVHANTNRFPKSEVRPTSSLFPSFFIQSVVKSCWFFHLNKFEDLSTFVYPNAAVLNQEHSHLPTGLLKPQISLVPASPVPKLKQEWSFKNALAFLVCCSLKDERLALSCHYSKGQNILPRVISCFIFQYLLIFHPSPFASDFLHPRQTHIPKYHSYFLTFRLFQLPGTCFSFMS